LTTNWGDKGTTASADVPVSALGGPEAAGVAAADVT
jgi:hypothetical protein